MTRISAYTEVIAFRNAKNVLEENGYDTDFAQWTRMGESIIITET